MKAIAPAFVFLVASSGNWATSESLVDPDPLTDELEVELDVSDGESVLRSMGEAVDEDSAGSPSPPHAARPLIVIAAAASSAAPRVLCTEFPFVTVGAARPGTLELHSKVAKIRVAASWESTGPVVAVTWTRPARLLDIIEHVFEYGV